MGNRVNLVLALSANTELPGVVFRDVTVTPDVQMLLLGLGHGLQIRVDLKHESQILGGKNFTVIWTKDSLVFFLIFVKWPLKF